MLKNIKNIDTFSKNIILVFIGTSLMNFFNLLYQLLVVHRLNPTDFAAFSSLLSIFMVISAPLSTIQLAVAKYSAEFNAQHQMAKIKFLLSDFFKKALLLAISTLLIFWPASIYIMNLLKIPSAFCGYILAALIALAWLNPLFLGGVQGLELFWWFASVSALTSVLKLALAFILIFLGYKITGALGAFLASSLFSLFICYFPLRRFIRLKMKKEDVNYKEILTYLLPIAISNFCFFTLVSFDMVLVKYFFSSADAGFYSLAQMVGKIFLFLPSAISIVMLPKISGLNAKNMDTGLTFKRALLYAAALCSIAVLAYNLFPSFYLKVLTGKIFPESVILGRLFSISMSFFALLYVTIIYFLSLKDFRFIKYLVLLTGLQLLAIVFFHKSLVQVQMVLCINAILLFLIHLLLTNRKAVMA